MFCEVASVQSVSADVLYRRYTVALWLSGLVRDTVAVAEVLVIDDVPTKLRDGAVGAVVVNEPVAFVP